MPDLLPGRPCESYGGKNGTEIGFHLPVSFHQGYINIYLSPKSISSVTDRTFDPYQFNFESGWTALLLYQVQCRAQIDTLVYVVIGRFSLSFCCLVAVLNFED
jgi:hypothetical protein